MRAICPDKCFKRQFVCYSKGMMRHAALICILALTGSPALAGERPAPGIWTNTEDVYFAEEEGRATPEPVVLELRDGGEWRKLDAFGTPLGEWSTREIDGLSRGVSGVWSVRGSALRRARPFVCWVSIRKFADKADGGADWTFANNLPVFDQGGRIAVPGEGLAPAVTLRMRNVTWARGSRNKPSLVIYLHRDDPERAESYSWASPDATLIGINLRWVQASCSPAEDGARDGTDAGTDDKDSS